MQLKFEAYVIGRIVYNRNYVIGYETNLFLLIA